LRDELVEHLLLKTERSNGKVENSDLHGSLGRVVRVRDSSGHEELERIVPWDAFVTEFQGPSLINLL
jgi:hypothetical protein